MPSYPYSLTLTNPGGETNDTSGWTNDVGSGASGLANVALVASGTDNFPPHSGSRCFRAGAAPVTRCHQNVAIPVDAEDDVDDENLILHISGWHSGFSGDSDSGALGIVFYDGSAVQIGEAYATSLVHTAGFTWAQRHMYVAVPSGTRSFDFVMHGSRSSGANLDSYWDDLEAELDTWGTGGAAGGVSDLVNGGLVH